MFGRQVQTARIGKCRPLKHNGLRHRIMRDFRPLHGDALLLHSGCEVIGSCAQTLIEGETDAQLSLHREICTNDVFLECHPQLIRHAMRAEALIILRPKRDDIGVREPLARALPLCLLLKPLDELDRLEMTAELTVEKTFDMISQKRFHAIHHRAILSFGYKLNRFRELLYHTIKVQIFIVPLP